MEYKLENMSLEEKVGQLFQIGFSTSTVNDQVRDMIENYHVGGVIYFSRNIESLEQTAELSNSLQQLALNSEGGIPLFISADQEGGTVTRLAGATHFPGNMALGAANDQDLTTEVAESTAAELKNLGINVNLAPVLDVNNNPDNPVIGVRSFGGDPELVAKLGAAYIKGLQSGGVIATAKHFPGHGDTDTDSHLDLPIIRHQRSRLNRVELYPFKKAIEAGVDSIMTAHVYFPAIEKKEGIPATLSKSVLTGLLRDELKFEGVIITDCMEMKAIVETFGTVEGAVKTIEAGSDTVLVSHSYQKQKNAIGAVIEAVKSGRISEKRIDASVKRILKLKAKRINLDQVDKADPAQIDFKSHKKLAEKLAEKSLTLVKNEDIFPLENIKEKKVTVIDFEMGRVSLAENEGEKNNLFVNYLNQKIISLDHIRLQNNAVLSFDDQQRIEASDLIIVCTYNATVNRYQAELAEKLAENNNILVLALRNPYDYQLIDKTQAFITTYDYSPASQKAAANFILGKIEAKGKLPVSVD
ncbi:beta-N-acetylhexosaminidase [Halanaerobium saccharolyticum]|nr:beta-N-acetylhexosaminidase [Halanaerobium saccharolyticum]